MTTRDATLISRDVPDAPDEPVAAPDGRTRRRVPGPVAFLRNIWRQLTSMRTALILLFLLALASLPGALLPQWSLNQEKTSQYILDHGSWGNLLDRLGFFSVFSSPWYAAIYLLLFTSLVGCLLPRTFDLIRQLRSTPVSTPRNLARLPLNDHYTVRPSGPGDAAHDGAGEVSLAADRVAKALRGWRVARRTEQGDTVVTISAEKGYLREVGNVVFHLSLLGLLVAVAVGKMFGYEGSLIITVGTDTASFCSTTPTSYDNFRPGLFVDGTDLTPFCLKLDNFSADYTAAGEASSFRAGIEYDANPHPNVAPVWTKQVLEVNDPLRIDGQRVYLLGHGFSPKFTVTYPNGQTAGYVAPFQPVDSAFTSQGAVKIPSPLGYSGADLATHQLAIVGLFAPTAHIGAGVLVSAFPAPENPGVAIQVYRGNLGTKTVSAFDIDQDQVTSGALKQVASVNLDQGASTTLSDGTKITFAGYDQWVSLQTSYDPAQEWALVFAITLLGGLMVSLVIKRRRIWFRFSPSPAGPGIIVVEAGGLARTDQAGYGEEFFRLARRVSTESSEARNVPRREDAWR